MATASEHFPQNPAKHALTLASPHNQASFFLEVLKVNKERETILEALYLLNASFSNKEKSPSSPGCRPY